MKKHNKKSPTFNFFYYLCTIIYHTLKTTRIMRTKITFLLSFFALLTLTASAQCPDDKHPHLIDLGLPSGTKWACCNVGAEQPGEFGKSYTWGETASKKTYTWETYAYHGEEEGTYQDIGSNIAGTDYDAARMVTGARYKMPTKAQFEELVQYCTHEFTSLNDHWGIKFTAPNGAFVFLPEAGSKSNNTWGQGYGCYWCADLDSEGNGQYLFVDNYEGTETIEFRTSDRWKGYSVHGVEGSLSPDDIVINEENFPDEAFRNYMLDKDNDGVLTKAEREDRTSLNFSGFASNTLKGVELFPNLVYLYLYDVNVDQLEVPALPSLANMRILGTSTVSSLDVSKCPALTTLYCYSCQLTSLNASQCTALQYIECYDNQLTSLNVSGCTDLQELYCYNNQLTELDVSKCPALAVLLCNDNQLTQLNLPQSTALHYLYCYDNQLTQLDLSQYTGLIELRCNNNQLTELYLSKNAGLQYLYCYENQLTKLKVSNNSALAMIACYYNQIRDADIDALVESLPTKEEGQYGYLYVFVEDEYEGNFMMKAQVDAANEKGWYAAYWPEVNEDNKWKYYDGHSHELEYVEGTWPGCENPGTEGYWKCNYKYCGKMFADENGQEEISEPSEIPPLGHMWGDWEVTRDAEAGTPGEETMTCLRDPSHTQTRPIYLITVTGGTASATQAAEGTAITVKADDESFEKWNVIEGDITIDETSAEVSFTMPAGEVNLEAVFIADGIRWSDATRDGKPIFKLNGQRARSNDKGIIIRKGKKVLRK